MNMPNDFAKTVLTNMMRIRFFEETVADLSEKKEFKTPIHLYIGQEAIAASVSVHLSHTDYAFSSHRNHGHYIAKGGSLQRLLAEIYCKETGCSFGHGGSMHVVDPAVGFMGSSAIVAGTTPEAVGAALAAKMNGRHQIAVAFFGDGATDEGVFYESLNMAALYQLPVLFVCENNLFSTHLPLFKRQKTVELYRKMQGFGIISERVDGNNPLEIYNASKRLIEAARANNEPSFLECMTYRWRAHVGPEHDIDIGFRKRDDIDYWKSKCPINFLKQHILTTNQMTAHAVDVLEQGARDEVAKAVRFAKESNQPDRCSLVKGLY